MQRRLVVGLTGYPNVGKSSTINALFGEQLFHMHAQHHPYCCRAAFGTAVLHAMQRLVVFRLFVDPLAPGSKKTAVAATPGKTKHFQTLIVSEALLLCDCPGLVLPRYAQSKAEMVAAGAAGHPTLE